MRILIAHRSSVQRGRLRARLSSHPGVVVEREVSELSAVYDFAEHHRPDCVVMAADMASCAEFELLSSLFRIMSIGCVLIGTPGNPASEFLSAKASRHAVHVSEGADDADFLTALRRARTQQPAQLTTFAQARQNYTFDHRRIILIGSSTGGVDALMKVLKHFPDNCPPTMIVQHTGGNFARSLIRLLDGATTANVQEAQDGTQLEPGNIYLSPTDQAHLKLTAGTRLSVTLQSAPLVSGHRPSVDALFLSAAGYARHVTAAILTGMGHDGAEGIARLRQAGARTIGQDETSSVVYGMPRVAMELGGIDKQMPVSQIGPALLRASSTRTSV